MIGDSGGTFYSATELHRFAAFVRTGGLASAQDDGIAEWGHQPSELDRWLTDRDTLSDPLEDERDAELEALDDDDTNQNQEQAA